MNEQSRKSSMQVVLLVVLLVALGFAAVRMMNAVKTPPRKARATASAPETATKMPTVATSTSAAAGRSGAAVSDSQLNANQFRVFELNPPKNPFVQREEWYAESLEQVPGYPELKSNDFFERTEAFLPDLPLFNEHDWESISIQRRSAPEVFEIAGVSEDGTLSTSINMQVKQEEDQVIEWRPESGVPLQALKSPDWYERYGAQLEAAARTKTDSADITQAAGLLIPGGDGDGDGDPEGEQMREGVNNGHALHVVGISRKGGRSRALVQVNDRAHLVSEGTVVPPHWQVLEIKDDGLVLVDLHDGSSKWIELSAAPQVEGTARSGRRDA